jgi:hypothetical protein
MGAHPFGRLDFVVLEAVELVRLIELKAKCRTGVLNWWCGL